MCSRKKTITDRQPDKYAQNIAPAAAAAAAMHTDDYIYFLLLPILFFKHGTRI